MSSDDEERDPLPRQLHDEFTSTTDLDSSLCHQIFGCTDSSLAPTVSDVSQHDCSDTSTTFTWYSYPPTPALVGQPIWRGLTLPWTWYHYDSEGEEEELSSSSSSESSSSSSESELDNSEVGFANLFPNLFTLPPPINSSSNSSPICTQAEDEEPLMEAPDEWLDCLDCEGYDSEAEEGLPHEECGDDSVFIISSPPPKRARHHE